LDQFIRKIVKKETPGVVNTCAYMGIQELSPEAPKELIK